MVMLATMNLRLSLSLRVRSRRRFKFRPDLNEEHIYENLVFIKGTKKSQTYPKNHGKVGKTADEIREDDQWSYNCRLAISRGKAMAIIMDQKGD